MSAPAVHVIYGYMIIDEIYRAGQNPPYRLRCMLGEDSSRVGRRVYLGQNARVFHYDEKLVLTSPDSTGRGAWLFPLFFCSDKITISWGKKGLERCRDHAKCALPPGCPGFVIDAQGEREQEQLSRWVEEIISLP